MTKIHDARKRKPKPQYYQTLPIAAIELVGLSVAAPIERAKLILQNQNELVLQGKNITYQENATKCIINIIKKEGPSALWRGKNEIFCVS